jgi:hypothetical protein
LNTYITSLSEHDDAEDLNGRLSMWRAFGGNNVPRVALILNVPKYSGGAEMLNVIFSPISYLSEQDVHAELDTVIQNVVNNAAFLKSIDRSILINWVFHMFVVRVSCLKHGGFLEEREWRAIYSPNRSPSQFTEQATEIISGVPQIVYKLPLDATVITALADLDVSSIFDRLIIGPSQYPWVMYTAFVKALTEAGIQDAKTRVWRSEIPIRS